MPNPNSLALIV